MKEKFYVTSSIAYTNGVPHIGHAYEAILTDAIARFKRLDGYDVFFLTGTDEHGLKIARSAEKAGLQPKEYVDGIVQVFKDTYKMLNISYDKFIRTTDKQHTDAVKKIVTTLQEKGLIFKNSYKGYYCVPDESYFTESQAPDRVCPVCKRDLEFVEEDSYFFELSKFQHYLEDFFKQNPDFLIPEARKNEILNNFIVPGLEDLSISRSNFKWGIPLPFDPSHVLYVWIDALSNYITALGYNSEDDELFKKYWPADVHVVGRDITRFHVIIWPVILHALGLPAPKQVQSHGFTTINGQKMSKSLANGYSADLFCKNYGTDAFRFYFLKTGPLNFDSDFSVEGFLTTLNSDLSNDLGNLVSRSIAMIEQYFEGIVPKPNELHESDKELIAEFENLLPQLREFMKTYKVDASITKIMESVRYVNKYLEKNEPWKLSKTDTERLKTVMYCVYEAIRIIAVTLQPFIVNLPNVIFEKLGITKINLTDFESIEKFNLQNYSNKVVKGDALFKRLDIKQELEKLNNLNNAEENKAEEIKQTKTEDKKEPEQKQQEQETSFITIDDFTKVELKVGTILNSEKVENSDRLLKNTVDINGEMRTIVSGVAKDFEPEQLIGEQVLVVANLKPIKLRGVESQGMILFADNAETGKLEIVAPKNNVPSGAEVK